ncbi:hypothetical protein R5R35_001794 [Gryllus longicercus]|uniref:Lipase n=1 Tax=Gryllus longicercus TaxID=2509291 RepID=A0AAN9ZE59_9ORTH|nr:Gastric triacylglycerol lipase [Gryllus bimaculatus]
MSRRALRSLHEAGTLDLPAAVDFVLEATAAPRLHVVAHSTGAAALLALLAERPQYNAKVGVAFLLAPAVLLRSAYSPVLRLFAAGTNFVQPQTMAKLIGKDEFDPDNSIIKRLHGSDCDTIAPSAEICDNILFRLVGYDSASLYPDVQQLRRWLPRMVDTYRVERPDFNHLDFLWAPDAPQQVYRRLLHLLVGLSR